MHASPPERNVFICSAAYSGSTLLDMVLGTHPHVESLGELANLPMDLALDKKCACGAHLRACPLWSKTIERIGVDVSRDWYALDLGYTMPGFGDPKRTSRWYRLWMRPRIAAKYLELRYSLPFLGGLTRGYARGIDNSLALYGHVRALTGKPVVVDSSKHYVRGAALYAAAPETTRLIFLVRDGRGVFSSGLKRGFARHRALRGWLNNYQHALALLPKRIPEAHRLLVRYEDIALHPTETLSRICEFVGIGYQPSIVDFRNAVHHNVNGNNMKFRRADSLRLDETWRTRLSPDDLAYFERHAGALNSQFGYLPVSYPDATTARRGPALLRRHQESTVHQRFK